MTREDTYYEAMKARDPRFDGKFFVGVKTTGIYCRPICPARPKRENVEFFPHALAAEKAGYRPCLRCRPESAPQSPVWIGKSAVVRRAVKMIQLRENTDFDEDGFAALFGVGARHLRRLFIEEIGKTPKQLNLENRLNLARKLLVETPLPVSRVAFASGYGSIRRFNTAFRERFKRNPTEIRRGRVSAGAPLTVTLPYRPPFDFASLLHFYEIHAIEGLEHYEPGKMHRIVSMGGKTGKVAISDEAAHSRLRVEIDFPDTSMLHAIISRVRGLFDLDLDPVILANAFDADPRLRKIFKKYPGVRLPSGWDGFEVAISAILGQLVSIQRSRELVADLIRMLGTDTGISAWGKPVRLFPTPAAVAASDLKKLKTTGMRKKTLILFSKAVAEKKLSLEPAQEPEKFFEDVTAISGIGPWTAAYMALKVIRHTDAFPATDLILARALKLHPQTSVDKVSPWRGYAAALLWKEYGGGKLPKEKGIK